MRQGQHSLTTPTRRSHKIALVAAPLVTVAAVATGIAATHAGTPSVAQPQTFSATASASIGETLADRAPSLSRSGVRLRLKHEGILRTSPAPKVTGKQWASDDLDVLTRATKQAPQDGEIRSGHPLMVTGRRADGFTEIVVDDQPRWVNSTYVSDTRPAAGPSAMGLDFTPCANTASVERGLVPNMIRAWEAVCHNFPQITTYGGLAPRPEHDTGHAVDAMTDDPTVGYAIAAFLQAHAAELDIYDIIYRQHIWTPVRASEGWRLMPDRGSPTANHFDHVHFSVN